MVSAVLLSPGLPGADAPVDKPYEGYHYSLPRGSLGLPDSPLKHRAQLLVDEIEIISDALRVEQEA
tara:strand:+ start:315 stop:512 length:198 start_codon:yes stop_codon:yes gene_type:complete